MHNEISPTSDLGSLGDEGLGDGVWQRLTLGDGIGWTVNRSSWKANTSCMCLISPKHKKQKMRAY